MGATYTVNPRTRAIEYIQLFPELISVAAFKQGVTATVAASQGGKIQIVIPAYINEQHFQRALPLMPGILKVYFELCIKLAKCTFRGMVFT